MKRSPDAERVLGQITRGQVLAGPEGAHRVAARHKAAYGSVWVPSPSAAQPRADNESWSDALASLTTNTPKDGA